MNRYLVRVFILLAIFGQLCLFYAYIANSYQHVKYSIFWHDEDVEAEDAKELETTSLRYLEMLMDESRFDDEAVAKRKQLKDSAKNFWKMFHEAYPNNTRTMNTEVGLLLWSCMQIHDIAFDVISIFKKVIEFTGRSDYTLYIHNKLCMKSRAKINGLVSKCIFVHAALQKQRQDKGSCGTAEQKISIKNVLWYNSNHLLCPKVHIDFLLKIFPYFSE